MTSTGVTCQIYGLCWYSVYRQQELYEGLDTELGKPIDDVNRNSTNVNTVRLKVEKHQSVADEAVVVKK